LCAQHACGRTRGRAGLGSGDEVAEPVEDGIVSAEKGAVLLIGDLEIINPAERLPYQVDDLRS